MPARGAEPRWGFFLETFREALGCLQQRRSLLLLGEVCTVELWEAVPEPP